MRSLALGCKACTLHLSPYFFKSIHGLNSTLSFFSIKGFYYLVKQYTRPLYNKMHPAVQNSGSRQKAKYISLRAIVNRLSRWRRTNTEIMRPPMWGKNIYHRSFQSCTDLRKQVSVLQPLKRWPQTKRSGTSVNLLYTKSTIRGFKIEPPC
jgi:hypothetical protein